MAGPLACSVPAWRNSLVFHDLEKITSIYIHVFPALLLYSIRWYQPTGTWPFNPFWPLTFLPAQKNVSSSCECHPGMLMPRFRHCCVVDVDGSGWGPCLDACGALEGKDLGHALLLYVMWQIMYFVKVEMVEKGTQRVSRGWATLGDWGCRHASFG